MVGLVGTSAPDCQGLKLFGLTSRSIASWWGTIGNDKQQKLGAFSHTLPIHRKIEVSWCPVQKIVSYPRLDLYFQLLS